MAGKGIGKDVYEPSTIGSVALAMHVRSVAKYYGIPVVLHSDHCAKSLLPWMDGMLAADEEFFNKYGEPLFGSHMLDLSEEPDDENIAICVEYFKRMIPMKIWLEMEIGITGGEEDGVDNSHVDPEKLYTSPEQVYAVYTALSKIGDCFSIAAAFGNVHGVYKPGNVVLSPERLGKHQEYTKKMINSALSKPLFLVMHGGSGSTDKEIQSAVSYGVIKMNIDTGKYYENVVVINPYFLVWQTAIRVFASLNNSFSYFLSYRFIVFLIFTDTQWAYWDGLRAYEKEKRDYLQGQIGNPSGADKPNKKFYDPRVWVRKSEEAMAARVQVSMEKLLSQGTYEPKPGTEGVAQIGTPKAPAVSPIVLVTAGAIVGSAATLLINVFASK